MKTENENQLIIEFNASGYTSYVIWKSTDESHVIKER